MARNIVEQTFDTTHKFIKWAGLSTETKPTAGIVTGSLALEMDTGDLYGFDETNTTWYKLGSLGGGS